MNDKIKVGMSNNKIQKPLKSKVIPDLIYNIYYYPEKAYISGFAKEFDFEKSFVSKYFKALEDLGFVSRERKGNKIFFQIKEENIIEIIKKIIEKSDYVLSREDMNDIVDMKVPEEEAITIIKNNEPSRKYLFVSLLSIINAVNREPQGTRKEKLNFTELSNIVLKDCQKNYIDIFHDYYGMMNPNFGLEDIPEDYLEGMKFFEKYVVPSNYKIMAITDKFLKSYWDENPVLKIPNKRKDRKHYEEVDKFSDLPGIERNEEGEIQSIDLDKIGIRYGKEVEIKGFEKKKENEKTKGN